jgi:hypothetical protein
MCMHVQLINSQLIAVCREQEGWSETNFLCLGCWQECVIPCEERFRGEVARTRIRGASIDRLS